MEAHRPVPFGVPGYATRYLDEGDRAALQKLLEDASDYALIVTGEAAGADDALGLLSELPPQKTAEDKLVVGLFTQAGELIGVADVVRDYPAPAGWWIGLLLLHPARRGQGLGRQVYFALEGWAAGLGATEIGIGVVERNEKALRFWQGVGFAIVEKRPPRKFGKMEQAVWVMRRAVGDRGK